MPNAIAGTQSSTIAIVSAAARISIGFAPMTGGRSPGVSCKTKKQKELHRVQRPPHPSFPVRHAVRLLPDFKISKPGAHQPLSF